MEQTRLHEVLYRREAAGRVWLSITSRGTAVQLVGARGLRSSSQPIQAIAAPATMATMRTGHILNRSSWFMRAGTLSVGLRFP